MCIELLKFCCEMQAKFLNGSSGKEWPALVLKRLDINDVKRA